MDIEISFTYNPRNTCANRAIPFKIMHTKPYKNKKRNNKTYFVNKTKEEKNHSEFGERATVNMMQKYKTSTNKISLNRMECCQPHEMRNKKEKAT